MQNRRKEAEKHEKKSQKPVFTWIRQEKSKNGKQKPENHRVLEIVKNRQKTDRTENVIDISYNTEYNELKKFILMKNNS